MKKPLICFFLVGIFFSFLTQAKQLVAIELPLSKTNNEQISYTNSANWHPSSTPFPKTREAWEWPFASESIWNLPLKSDAVYQPANIESGFWTSAEIELLYKTSQRDPLTRLYAPNSWTNRCSGNKSPTGNSADRIYVHFPKNKLIPDANPPATPNNSAAILQPDGETIVSIVPTARCEPEGPLYGWYAKKENIYGTGLTGGSGGSGLSTLGGAIRLGELTNDKPIRHALRINVWASKYLYYDATEQDPGYRWPALNADGYAAYKYGGTNANFEMGSLLAIPPDVKPEDLGLKSIPALKLFYALQNYGAYVADDTKWDVTAFSVQEGVTKEFEQVYSYKYETNNRNSQWYEEYYALVESLHLVINNSPTSNPIDENRLAPLAPPFISRANSINSYE